VCAAIGILASLESDVSAVAALPGEPHTVSAAGLAADESRILALENLSAFDPTVLKRRLVLVGADDPVAGDAVVAAVRWLKTTASNSIRDRWIASALPQARFRTEDTQSLARWLTFQAPDLVVVVGGAGNQIQLDGVRVESIRPQAAAADLERLLATDVPISALHGTIGARIRREPIAMAGVLARRYPETPSMSYIPAVAWLNTLRLAAITGDASLRGKVLDHVRPWLVDGQKLFGDRIQLTSVAGTMVFAEMPDQAAVALADEGARLAAEEKAPGVAQYGGGWTDDMFMATSILARTGRRQGRDQDFDVAARLLAAYAGRLQREDGLFNHATDGPATWGRGNGFAAMGLTEALTALPPTHAHRAAILTIYQRQMAAAKRQQAPDGMWREVIDEPGAYREQSATAMLLTAMARGVRLGWIDGSYRPAVERAWRALSAHVRDDGTIIDVCASTGGGPTRRYYLDRPAITGADDRGGAMALLAAMEMQEFSTVR
jgi:unsaturated rhamnogalacturonyl hydrolase